MLAAIDRVLRGMTRQRLESRSRGQAPGRDHRARA